MYLHFFERALREAVGDPTLALPYWDYTNDGIPSAGSADAPWRLPAVFAQERLPSGLSNPLFEMRRTSGFGLTVQLDPVLTNADSILLVDKFFDFQSSLDRLHGHIHCTVGNRCLAPYIGIVPFAGNDPVFWLHHANVDRLWDCWTARHGKDRNPLDDEDWMKTPFVFVDEKGDRATMKVSDLFDPNGRIKSTYDNTTNCFRKAPPVVVAVAMRDKEAVAVAGRKEGSVRSEVAAARSIRFEKQEQRVALTPAASGQSKSLSEVARLDAPQVADKALLTIKDIRVAGEPGASIAIFLADARNDGRLFVGVLSFFGLLGQPGGHHGHDAPQDLVFDISPQYRELALGGARAGDLQVALVASSGVSGPQEGPTEEQLRAASLTIGRIVLEIEPSGLPRQ